MCLASDEHKRDGVCLGLRDQNVQTLAMSQFQDLATWSAEALLLNRTDWNQALLNETVKPTEDARLHH